jgi:uncharacterized protein (TIGR02246 family)
MSLNQKLLYGSALCAAIVCLVAGPAVAGDAEAFAKIAKAYEKAYNSSDAAAVAALHTEDATVMPPNSKAVQGRKAIAAYIEQEMSVMPGKLKIEMVEHTIHGDQGIARGTYAVIDADGNKVDQGKWIDMRRKVDGKWYFQWDIWNSDHAAPAGD